MRRANGTGSIVKLDGNRRKPYAVRIPARDKYGRVRQQYLSYHRTSPEAQAALDAYNAGRAAYSVPEPNALSVTLQEVYDLWSAREYQRAGAASVRSRKASWKRLSVLKDHKMRSITVDHLQEIIDEDEEAGASQSKINNDKGLMIALYKYAMERDIVTKDCSKYVRVPLVGPKYVKGVISDPQLKQLEQMAQAGFPWADTVLMLCYTGFRITEFLTLTPFSYHPEEQYLQGGIKTDAGRNRPVPIHPKIEPYLDNWLKRHGETIICDDSGKQLDYKWYKSKAFATVVAELGLPEATPHWCRHTFSTRLNVAGVAELEQKRLLGHANKDVTEHYTHTDIAQLTKAILKLA